MLDAKSLVVILMDFFMTPGMLLTKWSELLSPVSLSGLSYNTQHPWFLVNNRPLKKVYITPGVLDPSVLLHSGWRPWFTEFKEGKGELGLWHSIKLMSISMSYFSYCQWKNDKNKQSGCLFLVIVQVHHGDKSILTGTCSSWSYSVPKIRSRAGWEMNIVAQLSSSFYLFSIQPWRLVYSLLSWIFPLMHLQAYQELCFHSD